MKNHEVNALKEAKQMELRIVRKHKLNEITIRNHTFFYKNRKKGFEWQQKKTTYKSVLTNIYVPNILDDKDIVILEKLSRTALDLGDSLLKITLTVNVPQVIIAEEAPDEFESLCNKEDYYLLRDGKDIRRQLEGIPCLLFKHDFELYDRNAFLKYCSQVEEYENPDATYESWNCSNSF